MKNKINLHNHTNLSDGDYSPYELIDLAEKARIKILAITDHDIIDAHLIEDLEEYAKKKDIRLINGIEVSTVDENKRGYHIVGLFIDVKNENLIKKIAELKESRVNYVKSFYNVFKKDGYYFDLDKILKEKVITKAHIADYAISNKKNSVKLIKKFGKIPTRGEFIETFMLPGQKFFVPKTNFHPKDAIKMIKEANGVAILAHPVFYLIKGGKKDEVVKNFLDWGIDGLEAYYIGHKIKENGVKEEIDMREEFKKICLENNLLISGGSDFHTDKIKKTGVTISLDDERVSVPKEEFLKIEKKASERWNKIKS